MILPVLATFLSLLIALNYWGWQVSYLGLALAIIWLSLTSWLLGGRMRQITSFKSERFIWGLIIISGLITTIGAVLFYLNLFNNIAIILLTALLPWLGTTKKTPTNASSIKIWPQILISGLIILFYLALCLIIFLLLRASSSPEAIRTPWILVSPSILILFAILAGVTLWLTKHWQNPVWIIPFYLVFLSLLINIYPLGYGFDPFIHQASEKLLATTGTISPKPFYYVGQYVLVNFWSQIFSLPIKIIDSWLVPLLAGLAIPISTYSLAKRFTKENFWLMLLPIAPLIFTLSDFTYTTPQGLAYIWLWLTIFLLSSHRLGVNIPNKIIWLMALAAIFTHPLAGLPILGITLWWWLKTYGVNIKLIKYWRRLVIIATALVVPAAFLIMSWLAPSAASIKFSLNIGVNLSKIGNNILTNLPFLPQFIDLPDAVYMWSRSLNLIFIILACLGYWLAQKKYSPLTFIGQAALLPLIGFLLLSLFFTWPNLPPNEQDFYTTRLWDITLLLLWPLVILGIYWLGQKIISHLRHDLSWLVAGSLILLAGFYLTYPRFDIWHHDTAYNTTAYDISAVQLINNQANNEPYVVLANQAVSAAAVNEFGFSQYYNGNFYYPLPTGTNPLYQVFLNAAERGLPMRDIIKPATNLGVTKIFLVLNRYWADYETLSQVAQKEANAWWDIGNGRLTVYRYDF